uniref:Orn/DAP/Arg decarboxylase 2 N-terminal domain-containing protein n=1 Tax=Eptatretus burgeri TaxID=7764 RepID=A0A8C4QII6_EPTBU
MKADLHIRVEFTNVGCCTLKNNNMFLQDERDAFFVADMGDMVRKHLRWHEALPRVAPFFAVKYNNKPAVIRTLACLGTGFDCISKNEIDMVLQIGVNPQRIIFGNPCKKPSHIKHAAAHGVDTMVFDCEDELEKVARLHPAARYAHVFLHSFSHVLPLCVLEIHLKLLDIGGGFHGRFNGVETFEEVASKVNEALDKNFPKGSSIHLIAEPGRYYVQSAITLAANVITKKSETTDDKCSFMYFVNNGIYSSFHVVMYNRSTVIQPLSLKGENEVTLESIVWGHTCAGGDCVVKNCSLPELSTGDWLIFKNMGAYSMTAWSTFNGFSSPECEFVMAQKDWSVFPIFFCVTFYSSSLSHRFSLTKSKIRNSIGWSGLLLSPPPKVDGGYVFTRLPVNKISQKVVDKFG